MNAHRFMCSALVACLLLIATSHARAEPLTFERALALAETATAVTAAQAQLELAQLALETELNPLTASLSGGATTNTDFTGDGTSTNFDLALNASVRVGWGAAAEAVAAARRSLQAAEDGVTTARTDALLQAARLYGSAQAAMSAREVAQLQLEIARLQAEAARARLEAGAALASDVMQAELAEKSAELDLAAEEAALAAALTELSLFLGVSVSGVQGAPVSVELPTPEPTGEGLALRPATEALNARADVRAARRDLEAASDALAQAHRASGVSFSGNASLSAPEGDFSGSLGASLDSRDLTPNLTGKLSASGTAFGDGAGGNVPGAAGSSWRARVEISATVPLSPPDTRVRQAELSYAQAEERLEQVLARAEVEVAASAAQLIASEQRAQLAAVRLNLARDAHDAAVARFELGVVSRVEVLKAQVVAVQAEAQVGAAELTRLQDLVAYWQATGRVVTEVLR